MRFFLLFIAFILPLKATEILVSDDFHYYYLKSGEVLPDELRKQASDMYYEAYNPQTHEGLTHEQMGIKPIYRTYEEFLKDLIKEDFLSYQNNIEGRTFFFVTKGNKSEEYHNIVSVAVVLTETNGSYYLDHIGVHRNHQKSGIGTQLLALIPRYLVDLKILSLDTRIFNLPGQKTYEKNGFERSDYPKDHPKEGRYYRYEKRYLS